MHRANSSIRNKQEVTKMRSLPVAIMVVVFIAALGFALYLRNSAHGRPASAAANRWRPAPRTASVPPVVGAEPKHVRGQEAATITLEEFADFECPACGQFYPILKSIESEYSTQVRVIFREFPLVQHAHARAAGEVAEAAGMQGKFWEMHDLLYENRDAWTKATDVQPNFEDYAQRLGLDLERFKRDRSSLAVQTRIDQDLARGRSLRLRATPTIFLNGAELPYENMKTLEALRAAVNKALHPEEK